MSNEQLLTILGSIFGLLAAQSTVLILLMSAKIAPVKQQVDLLVQYMVEHEGKIAVLEERTGGPTKKK